MFAEEILTWLSVGVAVAWVMQKSMTCNQGEGMSVEDGSLLGGTGMTHLLDGINQGSMEMFGNSWQLKV